MSEKTVNESPKENKFISFIDRFFHVSDRGGKIYHELIGGLVIFLAMFYILIVNANQLSNFQTGEVLLFGETFINATDLWAAVFVATAISGAITTIFMGVFGKLPIGLASGMGINSMVGSLLAIKGAEMAGFSFSQAMCCVLIGGILFLIISLTPLRRIIVNAIPKSLKLAISAGIGFFIAFIGVQNAGIIVPNQFTSTALGDLSSPTVYVAIIGILLVIVLSNLPTKNKITTWISRLSVIISMVIMAIVCGILGECGIEGFSPFYQDSFHLSQIGQFGKIFGSCFKGFDVLANPKAYAIIFTLLFLDFFDTTGTLLGVEQSAGMVDENGKTLVDDKPAMVVDAVGTCIGAVCGTSTVTSFVESTTGVAAGAKTGLAAIVTGSLFALSILIYPILSCFTSSAVTSLALVYVGICMFKNIAKLDWENKIAVAAGFVTIFMMICCYSISDGIAWGFTTYTVAKLASGKFEKKDIPVAVISVLFVILYIVKTVSNI